MFGKLCFGDCANISYKKKYILFGFVFLTSIVILTVIFQDQIEAVSHVIQTSYICSKTTRHSSHKPLVLFYTSWFGNTEWPWDFSQNDGKSCSHSCLLSYDRCDLVNSDAVVFHARDIPSAHTMKVIGKRHRNDHQRWVYLSHENPRNSRHKASPYNSIFNWTVTYRRDSDVFYPYGYFRKIQSPSEVPKNHVNTNYAKGKDKLVAWMVSNCGRLRDKIVHKFLNFVPVTIFGKCSKYFYQATNRNGCKRSSKECSSLLKTFKFYLAFENDLCFDYISEKFWETPFEYDIVPIVMGSDYDPTIAIPGSFINILDFPSLEALGNYIKYLDKNDTAYNEYFQWKTKFKIWKGDSWTCQLCDLLHNKTLPKKVYDNFGQFWGIQSSCDKQNSKIQKLLE